MVHLTTESVENNWIKITPDTFTKIEGNELFLIIWQSNARRKNYGQY